VAWFSTVFRCVVCVAWEVSFGHLLVNDLRLFLLPADFLDYVSFGCGLFPLRRPVDNYSFRYVVWLGLETDINEIQDR
jgi:hypothetical protein